MLGRVFDPCGAPRQSPLEQVLLAPGHLAGSEQNETQIQGSRFVVPNPQFYSFGPA